MPMPPPTFVRSFDEVTPYTLNLKLCTNLLPSTLFLCFSLSFLFLHIIFCVFENRTSAFLFDLSIQKAMIPKLYFSVPSYPMMYVSFVALSVRLSFVVRML